MDDFPRRFGVVGRHHGVADFLDDSSVREDVVSAFVVPDDDGVGLNVVADAIWENPIVSFHDMVVVLIGMIIHADLGKDFILEFFG